MDPTPASRSPSLVGYAAAACSGSIMGFFGAGHFTAAGLAFAFVSAGVFFGWVARGLAQ